MKGRFPSPESFTCGSPVGDAARGPVAPRRWRGVGAAALVVALCAMSGVAEVQASASAVSAGGAHTCALLDTGGVKCWGSNSGQLGDGTTTNRLTPVDVVGLSGGVTAISGGGTHTCALLDTGGVKCWGYNFNGQLGDGTRDDRLTPVDVVGLSGGVTAISGGGSHTCALLDTGGVKCWGYNGTGGLGDGTREQRVTPVDVVGLSSGVTEISAGRHTCALLDTGGVKCWGDNFNGQLGDGTTTDRLTPVDVVGLSGGVAATSAGDFHTCAVLDTGAVKCWGSGPLGDGTTANRLTPVDVVGLSGGVAAISTGATLNSGNSGVAVLGPSTCAVLDTGGVKCWGGGGNGALGDGTRIDRLSPVDVVGLSGGVAAISEGGWRHTCALLDTGGVKCWGWNVYGQLGDGTTTDRLTPVDVVGSSGGPTPCSGDFDCDSVPDNGDGNRKVGDHPCRSGQTVGCDDNCPNHPNPDQADRNDDSIGDMCQDGWRVACVAGTWRDGTVDLESAFVDTTLASLQVGAALVPPAWVGASLSLAIQGGQLIAEFAGADGPPAFVSPDEAQNYARAQLIYTIDRDGRLDQITGVRIQATKAWKSSSKKVVAAVRIWDLDDPGRVYFDSKPIRFTKSSLASPLFDVMLPVKVLDLRKKNIRIPLGRRIVLTLMARFDERKKADDPWCATSAAVGFYPDVLQNDLATKFLAAENLLTPYICSKVRDRQSWVTFNTYTRRVGRPTGGKFKSCWGLTDLHPPFQEEGPLACDDWTDCAIGDVEGPAVCDVDGDGDGTGDRCSQDPRIPCKFDAHCQICMNHNMKVLAQSALRDRRIYPGSAALVKSGGRVFDEETRPPFADGALCDIGPNRLDLYRRPVGGHAFFSVPSREAFEYIYPTPPHMGVDPLLADALGILQCRDSWMDVGCKTMDMWNNPGCCWHDGW